VRPTRDSAASWPARVRLINRSLGSSTARSPRCGPARSPTRRRRAGPASRAASATRKCYTRTCSGSRGRSPGRARGSARHHAPPPARRLAMPCQRGGSSRDGQARGQPAGEDTATPVPWYAARPRRAARRCGPVPPGETDGTHRHHRGIGEQYRDLLPAHPQDCARNGCRWQPTDWTWLGGSTAHLHRAGHPASRRPTSGLRSAAPQRRLSAQRDITLCLF
jgi:hypothetical protein